MKVAAIILAAGASERMGQVKALIRVEGKTLLGHIICRAYAMSCSPVMVVSGAHNLRTVLDHEGDRVREVHNDRWPLGQLSSIQKGLSEIDQVGPDCSGAIVFTVDRPFIQTSTIAAMAEAHRQYPDAIVQPFFDGRKGHPILIPRRWFEDWLSLDPSDSARILFDRPDISSARQFVPVEDPAIFDNFDQPEDFEGMVDVEF